MTRRGFIRGVLACAAAGAMAAALPSVPGAEPLASPGAEGAFTLADLRQAVALLKEQSVVPEGGYYVVHLHPVQAKQLEDMLADRVELGALGVGQVVEGMRELAA